MTVTSSSPTDFDPLFTSEMGRPRHDLVLNRLFDEPRKHDPLWLHDLFHTRVDAPSPRAGTVTRGAEVAEKIDRALALADRARAVARDVRPLRRIAPYRHSVLDYGWPLFLHGSTYDRRVKAAARSFASAVEHGSLPEPIGPHTFPSAFMFG